MEYDNQLDCFLIEDLNTFHGTYVNDCRVQNSKVKVDHGDIVRFGHGKDNISIVPKFFVISVQQIEIVINSLCNKESFLSQYFVLSYI